MEKKYILTDETMDWFGRTLHRIQAIRDFGDVKAGDLGGWIEKKGNLSQYNLCWVDNEAKVFDNAIVFGNAQVFSNAQISDNARVFSNAQIFDNARVFGNAQVFDNAKVFGNAQVFNNAKVHGLAKLRSNSLIRSTNDYITIGPIGSRDDYTTFAKSSNGDILVFCGCFMGTLEEFESRVKEMHRDDEYGRRYLDLILYIKNSVFS